MLVGGLNTLLGYGIIFYCMHLGVVAEISNFLGYFLGIIMSYFLNKRFTFNSAKKSRSTFFKFATSMYIAYIVNLIVLIIAVRFANINPYLSQVVAGISYTLTGFLLSKKWVFSNDDEL